MLLVDEIISDLESEAKGDYLLLEPHPDFQGQWKVNCLDSHYYFDFREKIGPYRAVSPASLESFVKMAETLDYKVAFFEDPGTILDGFSRLNEKPDITLVSKFDYTVNGLLPYQVQGYNMLKDQRAGVAMWDTGTGKTVLATALVKHHLSVSDIDAAWVVVKANNKINTQRKLYDTGEVESVVVPKLKRKRVELYETILSERGKVVVANYENFREDREFFELLFTDTRMMCVWDEMPTKLKNRTSNLYEAVKHTLFKNKGPSVAEKFFRPEWLAQYMLSATPIENSPEDWFNCVRLMDPDIYGTVSEFRGEYVSSYNHFDKNKPETWHKLDKIGLKAAHMTHQVDKTDPDIAKHFPEVIEEPFYVEWNDKDRKLYDEILKRGKAEKVNPLALINLLQMVCDEPTMLLDSAAHREAFNEELELFEAGELEDEPHKKGSEAAIKLIEGLDFSNKVHGKQEALKYLLMDKHAEQKTCVFTAANATLMPTLERRVREWGTNYVRYGGTDKQKQEAQDRFMEDPYCFVFLSSDQGSDSIDLYEGENIINYNLPWKWSTKVQRQNRIHRVVSEHNYNRVYTLVHDLSIEERKGKIIDIKKMYHEGVFKGSIKDQSTSARMTKGDIFYILTGERFD